ncbi:MAG: hypothetical protein ACFFCQ_09730 [Promethearchaeota archaeon]
METSTKIFILIGFMIVLIPRTVHAHTETAPFVVDLIAGEHIDVGDVNIWNDDELLYIKYATADSWCLKETHLQVATSLDSIPQKNGDPIPDQFDYKMTHECVTEYTYELSLTWEVNAEILIAAHAVVGKAGEGEGKWIFAQGELIIVTLWAGQNMDSGAVTVAIVDENLVVSFSTKDGWELRETHLYVAKVPPTTAAPGQFPYKHNPAASVTSDQYVLSLLGFDLECNDVLYIAAHASLQKLIGQDDQNNPIYQTEAGWGEGEQINGGWAMFFFVNIQCEYKIPDSVSETAWGTGNDLVGKNWIINFTYNKQDSTDSFISSEEGTTASSSLQESSNEVTWSNKEKTVTYSQNSGEESIESNALTLKPPSSIPGFIGPMVLIALPILLWRRRK